MTIDDMLCLPNFPKFPGFQRVQHDQAPGSEVPACLSVCAWSICSVVQIYSMCICLCLFPWQPLLLGLCLCLCLCLCGSCCLCLFVFVCLLVCICLHAFSLNSMIRLLMFVGCCDLCERTSAMSVRPTCHPKKQPTSYLTSRRL